MEELTLAVFKAWYMLDPDSLRKIWHTLQMTMDLILSVDGNNTYKLGHTGRKKKTSGITMTTNYVFKYRWPHAELTKESVCIASTVNFSGFDRDDNSLVSYGSEFEEMECDVWECLVFCSHFSCSDSFRYVVNLCEKHTVYLHA